ncbi:TetR family transcriptional regulator [Streptomyces sp. 1114.5]|uniref:TetR/AcrR family transcriptional regulator n=1 Tax=unclassified Streptomyces TaxID=2593676 RepID=UPI000BC5D056|nr:MULTISPECIES: TetR/AcrR family transcriptional regulator [unclassified Streptomyces]RKT11720.1 TetR family transcriptional regulator [Streptomyces sp. 1114.5]SOB80652.1 transcriptional regulator, TetR family [Streptomyces sp. 1331.2]
MTGRPTLNQRRRDATRLEIARTAAALFAEQGAEATTAEEIALAAGISLRTFYRYFSVKEDAVAPLLAAGGRQWVDRLAEGSADLPLREALESAAAASLTPADEAGAEMMLWTRSLLRDPRLEGAWQRVHADSEVRLRAVLAERCPEGTDPLEIRLAAAAATAAIRVALEQWAFSDAPAAGSGSPQELGARCMRELTAGLRLWERLA